MQLPSLVSFVMILNKEILLFVFAGSFLLLFFSCSDSQTRSNSSNLTGTSIRGEVVSLDINNSIAEIELLARSNEIAEKLSGGIGSMIKFQVQPGDLSLLRNKAVFRGQLQESFSPIIGKTFLLYNVWPDDPAERIRVNNINRLLRRDTLSMGESMIRTVGDTLPPFAFYDQDGEVVTTDYFDGSVTIMNFIFSRCSVADMCPASTMKMKSLQELAKKTKIPHIRFLSITLDPNFDSPGVLKSYSMGYGLNNDNFKFCTAKKSVIDDITRQFGIFRKTEENQPLDHTMRTMIVNSRRQIVYQVPGRNWRVDDFLSRLQSGLPSN